MRQIQVPPLFEARAVATDPFDAACKQARDGCDAGLVFHRLTHDHLQAAIVFAPDVPLQDAMAIVPICGVGFQNALGTLAPPEVGVHLEWSGPIRLNGGRCGDIKAAASGLAKDAVPDWLVVGLTLQLWPESDETGQTPDKTALYAEGCADVDAADLLEAWVRHTLVWINRWTDEGTAPLHKEWIGIAHGIDGSIEFGGQSGVFLGVDEQLGLLMRQEDGTKLFPLTDLLESDHEAGPRDPL